MPGLTSSSISELENVFSLIHFCRTPAYWEFQLGTSHSCKNKDENELSGGKTVCIFEKIEKFFDKKVLINTLHTIMTNGKISMSDFRMWFHLTIKK